MATKKKTNKYKTLAFVPNKVYNCPNCESHGWIPSHTFPDTTLRVWECIECRHKGVYHDPILETYDWDQEEDVDERYVIYVSKN